MLNISDKIIFITPNNANFVRFRLSSNQNINTNIIENFILKKPKENTLDLTSKNLYYGTANSYSFNAPKLSWYFIDGSIGAYGSDIGTKTLYKAKVEQGKTYTLRGIVTNINKAQLTYSNENLIKISGTDSFNNQMLVDGLTFTANRDDDVILRLQCLANSNVTVSEIQLEEASSATLYEPYYNYELAGIGEYKDYFFKNEKINPNYNSNLDEGAWYLKQNIDKYVYNNDLTSNGYTEARIGLITPKLNVGANLSGIVLGNISLCNLMNTSGQINNTGLAGTTSAKNIRIYISTAFVSTIDAARQLFADKNLTIYYGAETPTYEKIPNNITLYEQLEELNNYIGKGGTVVIETESPEENAQMIVKASALKNFTNE